MRRIRQRWTVLAALATAGALVVAACGGGGSGSSDSGGPQRAATRPASTATSPVPLTAEPGPEGAKAWFAALPPDIKHQLQSAGWSDDRLNAFLDKLPEFGGFPPLGDLTSILGPLQNLPIPPFSELAQALLDRFPPELIEEFIVRVGRENFNDLRFRVRPPQGLELLTLMDLAVEFGFFTQ